MKTGEFVYARTHAELLNELLGTNYKAWMKSSIMLPDGKRLWMIRLENVVSDSGWKNQLVSADRIEEKIVGELKFGDQTTVLGSGKYSEDRVDFDLIPFGSHRKYVFRGVFRINLELSSVNKNVWDKILDEYTL